MMSTRPVQQRIGLPVQFPCESMTAVLSQIFGFSSFSRQPGVGLPGGDRRA